MKERKVRRDGTVSLNNMLFSKEGSEILPHTWVEVTPLGVLAIEVTAGHGPCRITEVWTVGGANRA